MKSSSQKVWISLANVISCVAVVFLHCNGVFWTFPSGKLWYTSNLIETLFYWAVPVFFMISGATLLNYRDRYDTKVYFRKRFSRTFVPFVIWSLIGAMYWYLFWQNKWSGWRDFISGFFTSRYCAPYWYFFPLFSTYLSIPVMAAIDKDKRISIFKWITFVQIMLVSVMPTLFQILGITWNGDLYVIAAGGYMLYVLLGYLIANTDIKRKTRIDIYLLGIGGGLLQYVGTNILSIRDGQFNELWHGYFKIPEILMSIAIFTACKYIRIKSEKVKKIILFLSRYSFGVYLIHYYLVQSLPSLLSFNGTSILWRTIGAVLLYLLCVLIMFVASKSKVLRKIFGE